MGATVFNRVLVLVIIMVIGFLCRKTNILNDEADKKMSELLFNVTMPLMIIASFQMEYSPELVGGALVVLVFSFALHTATAFAGTVMYRRFAPEKRTIMKYVTVFPNCGFMGFPVMEGLFGSIGVFYVSIFLIAFQIFHWTYGIMIFTGRPDFDSIKKLLRNPGLISVFIGLAMFMLQIRLPSQLQQVSEMVGDMTIPLSMLIVGSILAKARLKDIFRGWIIYYPAAVRLLLLPLAAMVVLSLFNLDSRVMTVCVALTAMPAAANTVIFAKMFDGDTVLASQTVALTTMVSLATIPIMVYLVQMI